MSSRLWASEKAAVFETKRQGSAFAPRGFPVHTKKADAPSTEAAGPAGLFDTYLEQRHVLSRARIDPQGEPSLAPELVGPKFARLPLPVQDAIQLVEITDTVVEKWKAVNKPTVKLGSGTKDTAEGSTKFEKLGLTVNFSPWIINHVCTGHLMKELSFDNDNHVRAGTISLFPEKTSREDVAGIIATVLSKLEDAFADARGDYDETVLLRDHDVGGNLLTAVVNIRWDYDDEGEITGGTGSVEQFYFTKISGGTNYSKEEMTTLKTRLEKAGHFA